MRKVDIMYHISIDYPIPATYKQLGLLRLRLITGLLLICLSYYRINVKKKFIHDKPIYPITRNFWQYFIENGFIIIVLWSRQPCRKEILLTQCI